MKATTAKAYREAGFYTVGALKESIKTIEETKEEGFIRDMLMGRKAELEKVLKVIEKDLGAAG